MHEHLRRKPGSTAVLTHFDRCSGVAGDVPVGQSHLQAGHVQDGGRAQLCGCARVQGARAQQPPTVRWDHHLLPQHHLHLVSMLLLGD